MMAVAFLPVFYSKHALNDVVDARAGTRRAGRLPARLRARALADWALAGRRVGAATATKYTAGAMLLTRAHRRRPAGPRDRAALRRALGGLVLAGAACVGSSAAQPVRDPQPGEARGQISGQSRQADTGKLGQDDIRGWIYYVGTLGWGFGWLPLLAAAVGGALVALRRDWRRALLLVAFPLFFYLYMGAQAPLLRPLAAARLPGAVRARGLRVVAPRPR